MSVRGLFKTLRLYDKEETQKKETEARKEVTQSLDTIRRIVEHEAPVDLDTTFANKVNIVCEDLVFNNDGSYSESCEPCFFRPWPLSRLRAHPPNTQCTSTQETLKGHEECWEGIPIYKESYMSEARFMCTIMEWEFRGYKRTVTKK